MENMFSGRNNKRIPQTLHDCINPDSTVTNLHFWAERLENWGQILFGVLIVAGVISTIIDAIAASDIDEGMVFPTIITSILTWGLYAFIEYCAYHVLALLISALATITQNTIISANVALFESNKNNDTSVETKPTSTISSARTPLPKKNLPKGQRECYACGHVQSASNSSCEKCGEYLC